MHALHCKGLCDTITKVKFKMENLKGRNPVISVGGDGAEWRVFDLQRPQCQQVSLEEASQARAAAGRPRPGSRLGFRSYAPVGLDGKRQEKLGCGLQRPPEPTLQVPENRFQMNS